jgi:hypothetical protein
MSFRQKRLGFEHRIDDLEDFVERRSGGASFVGYAHPTNLAYAHGYVNNDEGMPGEGETVVIDGVVWTFRGEAVNNDFEVYTGASFAESMTNLALALSIGHDAPGTGQNQAGGLYMAPQGYYTVVAYDGDADRLDIQAEEPGSAGNAATIWGTALGVAEEDARHFVDGAETTEGIAGQLVVGYEDGTFQLYALVADTPPNVLPAWYRVPLILA